MTTDDASTTCGTAACLWLARRIDPGTVQAWCGHESIATTNQYLHYLGTVPTRRA
jgi:integrase